MAAMEAMEHVEAMEAGLEYDPSMMVGAEITTTIDAHRKLRDIGAKERAQQANSAGIMGDSGADAGVENADDEKFAKKSEKKDCYNCFFGSADDAMDGTHSTGSPLLDYYYRGDPAFRQEPITIKHNSIERKLIYYACAWLWCGCWEPKYKITNKYAIGEEWICCPKDRHCTCCIKITDSMAYENVDDLQKRQNCCMATLSCCGCCCRETCACNDMADIVLIGSDDSHPDGWKLRRIREATKLFNEVTKIVQDTQKDIGK